MGANFSNKCKGILVINRALSKQKHRAKARRSGGNIKSIKKKIKIEESSEITLIT